MSKHCNKTFKVTERKLVDHVTTVARQLTERGVHGNAVELAADGGAAGDVAVL